MCNDDGNHIPCSDYLAAFSELRIPLRFPTAAPNGADSAQLTGTKSPQSKWEFTPLGEERFCRAGLRRPMPDGGEPFTMLPTEPGSDIAPFHHRQVVVLAREDWRPWLFLERPEAEQLRALPGGGRMVEQVR